MPLWRVCAGSGTNGETKTKGITVAPFDVVLGRMVVVAGVVGDVSTKDSS